MLKETLLTLLEEERARRGQNSTERTTPKRVIDSIRFIGIIDEEIAKCVVPRLVQWEIDGDFSKANFDLFLRTSPDIHLLPKPIRHAVNKTVEQRRMDSLSRLLTVKNSISPCIAVAFYKNELIIASNSPKDKTEKELAEYLTQKIVMIRGFLLALSANIDLKHDLVEAEHIQFSIHAKLLAEKAARGLMSDSCGGVGDVLPNKAGRKRKSTEEHLKNALFKLGRSYLLGLYTRGTKGFSTEDIQILMSAPIIIPDFTKHEHQETHAEQAILRYLKRAHNIDEKILDNVVNIGISKLCCQACYNVLSRIPNKVTFRGSHGVEFPNVIDIDTGNIFKGNSTKKDVDLCASDSESENEFYVETLPESEDVPSLDELRARPTTPSHQVKEYKQNMLFKSCIEHAAGEQNPRLATPKATLTS